MTHDLFNAFVDRDPAARPGKGALSDLTIGVKSNIAVQGLPWTAGMELRRGVIAERDAEVVARLRAAGAAILGTLNMHEAALGSTTDNEAYGRTHNPHRMGLTPGGSSGGSGAAVAAGLCDVALGTDTLGSIRIPAAYCGVYGLKPSAGAVPQEGLVLLDARLDTIGPLARDLETLERVWQVIADEPGQSRPLTRLVTVDQSREVELEPAVGTAWRSAMAALDLPAVDVSLPSTLDALRLAAFAGSGRAIAGDLGEHRHGGGISATLKFVIDAALALPHDEALLSRARVSLLEALGDDGVIVLPTAPQVAFAHTPRPPRTQPLFTGLANIAGCPALAIPAGRDATGLPISVQLMGPPGSEPALIALARKLEPTLGGFVPPPIPKGE